MEKGKKIAIGIIIGSVLLAAIFTPLGIYLARNSRNFSNNDTIQKSPIVILDDSDFAQYNFEGDGSINNPFIIENYHIECTENYAIEISDTNLYFIIRNCNLKAEIFGIYISDISYGTGKIINNICSSQLNGIRTYYASGITISNNTCNGNLETGIEIVVCHDSNIVNNTCHKNKRGITIDEYIGHTGLSYDLIFEDNNCQNNVEGISGNANKMVFTSNIISNNQHGLSLIDALNSTIRDNYLSNNDVGFASYYSRNINILNNTFFNNSGYSVRLFDVYNFTCINNNFSKGGITFESEEPEVFASAIISNNTIDSKKLGFFYCEQDLAMINSEYGQLILVNCSDVAISNQEIANTYHGLILINCENVTVSKNIFQDNQYNIRIKNTNSSTLINNTCIRGRYGIYAIYSSYIDIINNTITEISFDAILFLGTNSAFFNNTLYGNYNGLAVDYSVNCQVFFNLFLENNGTGLICRSHSKLTFIYQNDFVDNIQNQAYDFGTNNTWYNSTINEGNYWSDWIGSGPYYIGGTSGAEDLYPLSERITK